MGRVQNQGTKGIVFEEDDGSLARSALIFVLLRFAWMETVWFVR